MNTRRETAIREEEGVANESVPPRVDQVPIVGLKDFNKVVPTLELQGPQGPQMPPMPQAPQAPFVEGDMKSAELRAFLMNLTQLMIDQDQVVTNHLVAQLIQGDRPKPNVSTPTSRIRDFMRMNPPSFHALRWMKIQKAS